MSCQAFSTAVDPPMDATRRPVGFFRASFAMIGYYPGNALSLGSSAMATPPLACPRCKGSLNLPRPPLRGQQMRCPQCGGHFVYGKLSPPPAPSPAPVQEPLINLSTLIAMGVTAVVVVTLGVAGFFAYRAFSEPEASP